MSALYLSGGRRVSGPDPNVDYRLKFVLIGSIGVGKTSIINQFLENRFTTTKITLRITAHRKVIELPDSKKRVELTIDDTAGEERRWCVPPNYFRGTQGVMLVYDITRPQTFEALDHWKDCCDRYCPDHKFIILIGNKSDRAKERKVSWEEAVAYANNNGQMMVMETSAKNDDNIHDAFIAVTEGICRMIDENKFQNTLNIESSLPTGQASDDDCAIFLHQQDNQFEQVPAAVGRTKRKCKC